MILMHLHQEKDMTLMHPLQEEDMILMHLHQEDDMTQMHHHLEEDMILMHLHQGEKMMIQMHHPLGESNQNQILMNRLPEKDLRMMIQTCLLPAGVMIQTHHHLG